MNEWLIARGGGAPAAILAVAVLFLNARLIGLIFEKATGMRIRHPVLSSIVLLVIGIDFLIFLTFLAGVLDVYNLAFMKYAMFMSAAVSAVHFFRSNRSIIKPFVKYARRNSIFLGIFGIVSLGTLGNALCLPISWDELCYQLAVPFRWLSDGGIFFYPDNPYSGFPGAGLFAFLLNIYLGGLAAPRLFIWALWMLSLVSTYHILRPGTSALKSAVMTFSFGLSYGMFMAGSSAYADLIILIHFISAFAIIKNSNLLPSSRNSAGLGILCGMASSIKLTGLIVGFSFFVYLAAAAFVARTAKARSLVIYSLAVSVVVLIFYLRPFMETGNPFYPYCAKFFSGTPAVAATSEYHHSEGSIKYNIHGIAGFVSAPILASLPVNTYDGSIGLQFLPAMALSLLSFMMLLKKKRWGTLLSTAFFLFLLYAFWFFTAQLARYMLLVVFMAYVSTKPALGQRSSLVRLLLASTFVLTLWGIPSTLVSYYFETWKTATGLSKTADFVFSGTGEGFLYAMDFIRVGTPQNSKFLLLFEHRGLYMPRKYEIGSPFFQEKYFTPAEHFEDDEKIMEVLRKNGITHVLVGLSCKDPDRMEKYLERSIGFSAAIGRLKDKGKLARLWEGCGYTVFECKY